jgi:hypothetical protein
VSARALATELTELENHVETVVTRVSSLEVAATAQRERADADRASMQRSLRESLDKLKADADAVLAEVTRQQSVMREEVGDAARWLAYIFSIKIVSTMQIDSRAYITSVEATDENVSNINASVQALARQVEVCLKFSKLLQDFKSRCHCASMFAVSWYHDSGEKYEGVLRVLEQRVNAGGVEALRPRGGGMGSGATNVLASLATQRLDGEEVSLGRPAGGSVGSSRIPA